MMHNSAMWLTTKGNEIEAIANPEAKENPDDISLLLLVVIIAWLEELAGGQIDPELIKKPKVAASPILYDG